MARNLAVGVDVGSATIQTLVTEQKNDEISAPVLGFGIAESRGLRKGEIVEEKELLSAVKESLFKAQKSSGVEIEEVYLGISGETLKTFRSRGMVAVSRADGEITEFDVLRVIEVAKNNLGQILNREIIHAAPITFKIDDDFITQNPAGLRGMRLEADVFFITALGQHLKKLVKIFENAGAAVARFVPDSLALAKSALTKNQREVGVLLLDIGGSNITVSIFENDVPISLEVFPIGSSHITNDIAIGFQIPLHEAEELKTTFQNQTLSREQKKKLDDIIGARLGDIFELVEKHLRKTGKNNLLPAGVVVAGGGANLSEIVSQAKKNLKLPADKANFNDKIKAPRDFLYFPEWATAAGLCLFAFEDFKSPSKTENFIVKWFRSLLP